jgi:hypothetical protein
MPAGGLGGREGGKRSAGGRGAKGGYKSRRGVRLEGQIDHILRRRIVLRERELIPHGLRPDLLPAQPAPAVHEHAPAACPPEQWDRFSGRGDPYAGAGAGRMYFQAWGDGVPGATCDGFLASMLPRERLAKFDQVDHYGTHGGFDLSCAGPPSHPGMEGGEAPRGSLHWSAGGGPGMDERNASLLDILRSPHGQPPSSPGAGLISARFLHCLLRHAIRPLCRLNLSSLLSQVQ